MAHLSSARGTQGKTRKEILEKLSVTHGGSSQKGNTTYIISFTIGMYANLLLLTDLMPVFRIEGILLF